jgi:viral A-type inclusion protein repeat, putative
MTRNNEKISLLIEKLKSINENIFFDLLVDNFNNELLEKKFGKPFNKNSIFFEREIDIIGKIDESNKDFLRKIVETNNSYVEKKCLNFVKEDYLREFQRDKILRVNGRGLNPEQMIMYVLSTNKLVEFLDFFKEEYFKYIEKLKENKQEILGKETFLKEAMEELENEDFEKEFQESISAKYINVKKRNLEKLSQKYGLEFDEENRKFNVSAEFISFFDEKMKEYFLMRKNFKRGFEFFNINSYKVSEKERDLEEIITDIEGIEQENKFLNSICDKLEEENKKLKEDLRKHRNKEAEKTIEKQKKEIEKLNIQIKSLEKEIENMEQDENIEVVENVNIKELSEEKTIDLTNQNVKVVGGRWSQKVIEKAEKYAKEKGFKIEFIHATAVFRNSDKLKNSDIVIFDTSYNSHSAYYKLKSCGLKIYRISTSNLDRIKNLSK